MTYVWGRPNRVIIDHTAVFDGNNGKGFWKKLAVEAVNFARDKGIKILPLCPYSKSVFEKTPEYKDVL